MLLLAGGTGLAPVLSMLRTLRDGSSRRKAHLIYGVSTDEDLVALDEIEEIAATLSGFTWDYCVSDPAVDSATQGLRGKPHQTGRTCTTATSRSISADRHRWSSRCAPMSTKAGIEPTGFYYEKFALAHVGAAPEPASAPPSVTSPEQALLVC